MSNQKYEKLLKQQLAMNVVTFEEFKKKELNPNAEFELDFFYYSKSKDGVNRLSDFLKEETDYHVETSENKGLFSVKGHTQKTKINKQMLDDWVDWMVSAGAKFDCDFDGWGVEL